MLGSFGYRFLLRLGGFVSWSDFKRIVRALLPLDGCFEAAEWPVGGDELSAHAQSDHKLN